MTLPIEIIAASAGSGKTYTLAQILSGALAETEDESISARPENVIAVTFTIKAAAELEERVRQFLVENGRSEDAHRMAAARIGTVHSVCSNLIRDFAFDLGISPQLDVLDEAASRRALKAAFSAIATPERQEQLAEIKTRMFGWDWEETRREILAWARHNAIDAEGLRRSKEHSLSTFQSLLEEPLADPEGFEKRVVDALKTFLKESPALDTTIAGDKARELARKILYWKDSGGSISWDNWHRLSGFEAGAKSRELTLRVAEAAFGYYCHPQLRADLENAISLAFDLAADALEAYQAYKTERGVVDFPDQLGLALELLRKESVREQLRGSIDLVLVDEFQDTSPIQLAVFIELASLAKRSVWVGDQKQAIYGFLGCDPVLMDSAIDAILGGEEPRTLKKSWRSRPDLVSLTSDLFAPAFDQVGIPPERTRLEPAFKEEPDGLGPVVERWRLDTSNQSKDAAAIAAGVREMLLGDDVRVRDSAEPDGARAVRASDIAVLCRTNAQCVKTAEALGALGVPCVLARPGLLKTPEAELVVQGLARWADPRDTLAAAIIARLIVYPADGQEWLDAALEHPKAEAFAQAEPIAKLDEARQERPAASVIEAFDQVVATLGAREFAAGRGEPDQRLANIEALRSLAMTYMGEVSKGAGGGGASTSPAGFVAWLRDRAKNEEDQQAVLTAGDAVVVSTWHGAKGLEWPITILFGLKESKKNSALGVHIEAPADFDFDDPLAGRWIRFWPNPYGWGFKNTPLHSRVGEHAVTARMEATRARETLRLRYVGWTRARDRVVLVSRAKQQLEDLFDMVYGPDGVLIREPSKVLTTQPPTEEIDWAGHRLPIRVRELAPIVIPEPIPLDGVQYAQAGPQEYPPAVVVPSGAEAVGEAGEPIRIGERIAVAGSPEWRTVGELFHGFLAADSVERPPTERLEMATGLLERWELTEEIRPEDVVGAADRMHSWIESTWPGATHHHEWPLLHRLANGSEAHGSADLVLELDDQFVLVDHKTFPGGAEQAREAAAGYGGQLKMYAEAIEAATGKKLGGAFIHLPVTGMAIKVN